MCLAPEQRRMWTIQPAMSLSQSGALSKSSDSLPTLDLSPAKAALPVFPHQYRASQVVGHVHSSPCLYTQRSPGSISPSRLHPQVSNADRQCSHTEQFIIPLATYAQTIHIYGCCIFTDPPLRTDMITTLLEALIHR